MKDGPNIKGNPSKITVGVLVVSYVIGEFIVPKYTLIYICQLIGMLGLLFSILLFFSGTRNFLINK